MKYRTHICYILPILFTALFCLSTYVLLSDTGEPEAEKAFDAVHLQLPF